jgi:ribosomal protein S18 acetylase RimI-like enzyme/aminoglycoside phosphotransferase (APT) family kinase protein
MTLTDVDDIVGILCAATDDPGMEEYFRLDALEQARGEVPGSVTYLIIRDDQKVGRLRVVRAPGYIEIAGLQVHPDWQRRGIGTTAITTILNEGESAGLPVELNVDQTNIGAQRLYTRLGFERAGANGNDYRMRRPVSPRLARVPRLDAAALLAELNDRTGAGLRLSGLADRGQVGAAYVVWPDGREGVLTRSGAAAEDIQRTARQLSEAAAAGLPVPRYQTIADLGGQRAIVQERLTGAAPEVVDDDLVDAMIKLLDGFAGLGKHADDLELYLTRSGPGYCVHETLAGYDDPSRSLLDRIEEIGRDQQPEVGDDLVHLDFHPANLLVHDGRITGLIDWDGVGRGDRRFGLVTLIFDLCFGSRFHPGYSRLTQQGFEIILDRLAPAPVAAVRRWWAHISLRQVDWTIRHDHGADVVAFYTALALRGLDRLDGCRQLCYGDLVG